jgi:hypothetical protein
MATEIAKQSQKERKEEQIAERRERQRELATPSPRRGLSAKTKAVLKALNITE